MSDFVSHQKVCICFFCLGPVLLFSFLWWSEPPSVASIKDSTQFCPAVILIVCPSVCARFCLFVPSVDQSNTSASLKALGLCGSFVCLLPQSVRGVVAASSAGLPHTLLC